PTGETDRFPLGLRLAQLLRRGGNVVRALLGHLRDGRAVGGRSNGERRGHDDCSWPAMRWWYRARATGSDSVNMTSSFIQRPSANFARVGSRDIEASMTPADFGTTTFGRSCTTASTTAAATSSGFTVVRRSIERGTFAPADSSVRTTAGSTIEMPTGPSCSSPHSASVKPTT